MLASWVRNKEGMSERRSISVWKTDQAKTWRKESSYSLGKYALLVMTTKQKWGSDRESFKTKMVG